MLIRKATKKDIETISRQSNKLIKHVRSTSGDVYICNLKSSVSKNIIKWIESILDSDTEIIFIAEDNSKPIGFIMGKITKPFLAESKIQHIGYIDMCWTDSSYRGKGIGKKLTKELEKWFKKNNLKYVDVNYLIGNKEAEYFWEKTGYIPYRTSSRKELK